VLASRTREQLDEVAAEIRAMGRRALVVPTDVVDNDAVTALVPAAVEEFGRVDVVVNNAGGTAPRPFLDTSPGYLERSFHFNVTTAFVLTKAAVPVMLEQGGGTVVNISSTIGRLRDRGFVAYGTAKAALTHMTRLMAADLAPKIRVNGIAVGSIATSALETVLTDDGLRTEMVAGTPLKRLGEPEDIAIGAVYLASPASSFVTGKLFEIDGGLEEANLALGLPDL
jgi:7-alpha-hydroxysteroid dehydrogenase